VPDLAVLERCLVDDADALPAMRPRKRVPQPRRARLQLVVRVDDVVALDAPLLRLLQRLSEAQFAASLEVVPALCRFADADLDILDAGHLFTVGQHGYAHIPRVTDTPEQLAAGRAMLLQRFPTRFHGGLSAPYDRVPEWLGATWRELGGAFLSCITAKPPAGAIPLVRVGTEAWDWARDRRRSIARIVGDLERQSRRNGYAGLVFHPWLLARPGEDEHLARLLDALARAGAVGASIAGVAR
jgi:peptidoglycan/xylan/chitin deacetylase (PgdA/CDA1 family)